MPPITANWRQPPDFGAMQFQLFDPQAEHVVTYRKLPHWEQAGATYFITFRTADSLPESVIRQWEHERDQWLQKRGISSIGDSWRARLAKLPLADRRTFHETFTSKWFDMLDDCHGECVLKDPELAQIVADSLHHFDNDRYTLGDFVVMPNHVHLLVAFPTLGTMKRQCKGWKHFMAAEIHRKLGRHGHFWQAESFDHLVRSMEEFDHLRRYVADNPRKARLRDGEFLQYRRDDS